MSFTLVRTTHCFLCLAAGYATPNTVDETIQMHMLDADAVPDQGNCDFSKYTEYTVEGGILVRNKAFISSTTLHIHPDAVCNQCLTEPRIRKMVSYALTPP